jgi:OFA family oxalate/formate antiporter-like MFS transporter
LKNPRFQLAASLVTMVMIANLQYSWTLFVRPMQEATSWKLSDIQWAFTIFILLQTWVQPIQGWLVDRIGPRLFITVAGILCGTGWSLLGYVRSPLELYTLYGLAGIGAAFVYNCSIGSALKWFPGRRGLAAGIIAAGFGSGTALTVPFIAFLISRYDYRTAFLWTGAFQGLVIAVTAQFLRHPGAELSALNGRTGRQSPVTPPKEEFTTGEMLRTPHFYMLYAMFVMMATGGLLVTAQAGPVARSWNITLTALTVAAALSPIANGISRIFWGAISDRIGRETTMFVAFGLQAGCLMAVLTIGHLSGLLFAITLVLTFFTWGEIFSLFPSTLADYFGSRNAASNYGFLYSAKGVASVIAGGAASVLFEQSGSWSALFCGSAALSLFSAAMALRLRSMRSPKKAAMSPRRGTNPWKSIRSADGRGTLD